MAELNLKQITEKLNAEFAGQGRKLVFWYDGEAEFAEDIETLELDNAKICRMEADNQFYTKYHIEKEDPNSNYLLYAPFPKPDIRQNHLADTLRYSKEFFADRTSLICLDLGIREELKPVIQKYLKFFAGKQRSEAFYALDRGYFTRAADIENGLMAILCKAPNVAFEDIIRTVYNTQGVEDNAFLSEFDKFNLTEAFWRHCEAELGYADAEPSLEKLLMTMFVTYIRRYLQGQLPKAWQGYLSTKETSMVAFLDNTMNSTVYGSRFDELSDLMAETLHAEQELNKLDIDLYAECAAFRVIDEIIIDWAIGRILSGDLNARVEGMTIPELCETRKKLHFGSLYRSEYDLLKNAYLVVSEGHHTPVTGAGRIAEKYIRSGYRIDQAYRSYYYSLDKPGDHSRFEELTALVESTYTDGYLSPLCSNFSHELEDADGDAGLARQLAFFERKLTSLKEKTVVFISDALRYEVGYSLYELLEKDEKATVSISAMQAMLPTFTQLGMAALLPHNTVQLSNDSTVLLDGAPCDTLARREAILQHYKRKSRAVRFDDVKNLKQNDLRAIFTGMDIVYVYHNQVDARGDKPASENEVFNACQEAVDELAPFIRRLSTCANVYHFFVTADHGFLYRRSKLQPGDKISSVPHATHRYAINPSEVKTDGVVNFLLDDIIGYSDGRYVSCPAGPDLFNAPGAGLNYIHGGCSPQEIIIPLIEARLEKAKVETGKAKISLINLSNKITNLITQLDFLQDEPVGDTVKPCAYHIYFEDEEGSRITGDQFFTADSTAADAQLRKTRLKFTFKNQTYPAGKKYYLIIKEDKTELEIARHEFRIDIAFANDFGF